PRDRELHAVPAHQVAYGPAARRRPVCAGDVHVDAAVHHLALRSAPAAERQVPRLPLPSGPRRVHRAERQGAVRDQRELARRRDLRDRSRNDARARPRRPPVRAHARRGNAPAQGVRARRGRARDRAGRRAHADRTRARLVAADAGGRRGRGVRRAGARVAGRGRMRVPSFRKARAVPLAELAGLHRAAQRTSFVRVFLAAALAGTFALLFVTARSAGAGRAAVFPQGVHTGVVVLDMSASISGPTYSRVATTLRGIVNANESVGLVMFSDTAY